MLYLITVFNYSGQVVESEKRYSKKEAQQLVDLYKILYPTSLGYRVVW